MAIQTESKNRVMRALGIAVVAVSVGGLLLAGHTPAPASAAGSSIKRFTLDFEGVLIDFAASQVGSDFFEVNGVARTPKQIVMSGTAVKEGGTMRFGVMLHNQIDDFIPVVWEFTIDIATRLGSGEFQHLTNGELEGPLVIGPAFRNDSNGILPGAAFGMVD